MMKTLGMLGLLLPSILLAQVVPTITSFSPISGPVGATVTITGSNFNTTANKNIVYFGAVKATVTGATSSSLGVTVPPCATYAPITVTDTTTGSTAYSNAPFVVTFPSSQIIDATSFASGVGFTAESNPEGFAVGDLDGDGKPDLVVANGNTGNTVSVFRNTGATGSITTSSFAPKVDLTTATNPDAVAIGDLDGDGKLDIVVLTGDDTVSVFRNASTPGSISTSSFAPKVGFRTASGPAHVAICDLDGDGKPDLVVTSIDGGSAVGNIVSVFRNTSTPGSISFATRVDFTTGGTDPQGVAICDMDGDGKPDVVVAVVHSDSVEVFRNTSTPGSITSSSFAPEVAFAATQSPFYVAIGDLDGDGKPDIVVTNTSGVGLPNSNTISIFRNTCTPGSITASSFTPKVDVTTGMYPYGAAIADVDGDGKPDVVVTSYYDTVSVFKNTSTSGSISFASRVDLTTGTQPTYVAICDVDGDGKPEIIVLEPNLNNVAILQNDTPLPVELTSFTASTNSNIVELAWNTATEVNNYGFEVQRSTNGTWQKIGFVAGAGTSNSPKNYSYVDQNAVGKVSYRLKQIDRDGNFKYSETVEVVVAATPAVFKLSENYPEPFNPSTTIHYVLASRSFVTLAVYNTLGQKVAVLVNEEKEPGNYEVRFDASGLASGVYLCRMQAGSFVQTRKLVVVK